MALIRIKTDEEPYKSYNLHTSRVPVVGEFVMIGSLKRYKVIEVCHIGADKVHDSYVAFVKIKLGWVARLKIHLIGST